MSNRRLRVSERWEESAMLGRQRMHTTLAAVRPPMHKSFGGSEAALNAHGTLAHFPTLAPVVALPAVPAPTPPRAVRGARLLLPAELGRLHQLEAARDLLARELVEERVADLLLAAGEGRGSALRVGGLAGWRGRMRVRGRAIGCGVWLRGVTRKGVTARDDGGQWQPAA